MMHKYIDAEQLEDVVAELNSKGWGITRGEFKLIDRVLFEFPAANVVKVRHGRWVRGDEMADYPRVPYNPWETYCSCCGEIMEQSHDNFCGNCGAKMDEDEK